MLIRCEQCGYENFPQHRFCGMCGAKIPDSALVAQVATARPSSLQARSSSALAHAEPMRSEVTEELPEVRPPKPPKPVTPPVNGPSFLGLSQETERDRASYLLDDDEPSGHRGAYLAVLLFVLALGLGVWHWRENLTRLSKSVTASQQTNTDSSTTAATAPVSNTATTTPPAANSPAPATDGQSAATPGANATSANATPAQTNPPASDSTPVASEPAPAQPAADQPAPNTAQSTASDTPRPVPATKKAVLQPASTSDSVDDMETDGEKYLYGNGVPANCDLARKNLLTAAGKSNGRAQSILGTMYATGHCAPRDFPLAYRWFAKALHQDPHNSRIEEDLKVLWNQMTPDERNLALRGE